MFFQLAIEDVREAADQIRDVYDATGHLDGFVSFELPPGLANDCGQVDRRARPSSGAGSIAPTSSSRSPARPRASPAIEESIFAGINVNVTLLFSLAAYDAIHEAFIRGLERRVEAGLPVDDVHSVASFFVSRVDTAVDGELPEGSPLRGRAAVANAKLAYQHFEATIAGDRWQALAARGARVQRPLWASTGTKNAAYSDVLYVDSLIGPDTVNTMPEATIAAFADHGTVARTVDADVDARQGRARRASRPAGVDLDAVTKQLELDGVKSFSASFDSLLETIQERLDQIGSRGAA